MAGRASRGTPLPPLFSSKYQIPLGLAKPTSVNICKQRGNGQIFHSIRVIGTMKPLRRKGGLRRRPPFIPYFYFIKLTPFTMPTFEKFYIDERVGVRGETRVE